MLKPIVRRSDFVAPLAAQTRVTADTAQVDRIELSFGDWALVGDEDAIVTGMNDLYRAHIPTSSGRLLPLFKGELIDGPTAFRNLRFAKKTKTDSLSAPQILIAGAGQLVSWSTQRASRRPDEKARIRFRTHLNLTRFLQAQNLKRIARLDRPAMLGRHRLTIEPEPSWYEHEIPLMPATNIIIGPDRKYAFALKESRQVQFSRYSRLVAQMLEGEVSRAIDSPTAKAQFLPSYTLHAIELYWEFDQQDSIAYVVGLRQSLLAASRDLTEDTYPIELPSLRVESQSPSYKIRLTKFISLKVYAKTNRRVRFEVSFREDGINVSTRVGKLNGRRSHETLDGICALLPRLAAVAASRVNILLQSIAEVPVTPNHHTTLQLVHAITREAGHPYVAETIISSLVAFGRVALFKNDPLKESIHRLKERGILRTEPPGSPTYVLTDQFRETLERLRKLY
jgi:hypothetical protein